MNYVVYCVDNNVSIDAGVSIHSLFSNNNHLPLTVYILHKDVILDKDLFLKIPKNSHHKIIFKTVDDSDVKDLRVFADYTVTMYYKLLIPKYIPSTAKKVLYLDTDTLVVTKLDDLFNYPLNSSIGVVEELGQNVQHCYDLGIEPGSYFNSGMMLLNFDKINTENFLTKMIESLNKVSSEKLFGDQDIFNVMFRFDHTKLSSAYNYCYYFNTRKPGIPFDCAKIIHYAGSIKPKNFESIHPLRHIFRVYMKQSPWADRYGVTIKSLILKLLIYCNLCLVKLGLGNTFSFLKKRLLTFLK